MNERGPGSSGSGDTVVDTDVDKAQVPSSAETVSSGSLSKATQLTGFCFDSRRKVLSSAQVHFSVRRVQHRVP